LRYVSNVFDCMCVCVERSDTCVRAGETVRQAHEGDMEGVGVCVRVSECDAPSVSDV
jgi:hypothetical protein